MNNRSALGKSFLFSQKVYGLLLLAYPQDFRREYGTQMAQVFRDCYRAEKTRRHRGVIGLWLNTLFDLIRTAPQEHLQNIGEGVVMKAIRNLLIAIIVYTLVIVITGKLLVTARTSLPFVMGSFIDALVSTGILFNFIVLLLVSTKLMVARRAVVTSAVATGTLVAIALSLIATRVPADARPGAITVLTLATSLIIWFVLHWLWAQRRTRAQPAT